MTTPVKPMTGNTPSRIAERARLSLQGARAVAGKTLSRWTTAPTPKVKDPEEETPAANRYDELNVMYPSKSLEVDDEGLLKVSV